MGGWGGVGWGLVASPSGMHSAKNASATRRLRPCGLASSGSLRPIRRPNSQPKCTQVYLPWVSEGGSKGQRAPSDGPQAQDAAQLGAPRLSASNIRNSIESGLRHTMPAAALVLNNATSATHVCSRGSCTASQSSLSSSHRFAERNAPC